MIRLNAGLPPLRTSLLAGLLLAAGLVVGVVLVRGRNETPSSPARASLKTHYLIDYEYLVDAEHGFATMGHLLIYNPGERDADVTVTVYQEDQEPGQLHLRAAAQASTESNYTAWPVTPNHRCALKVESSEPVVCQATVGWTNTGNDYRPQAATTSPHGVRETAKSYTSIPALARTWYLADGIILNNPDQLWIRESEWAVLLNPGAHPAQVTLTLHDAGAARRHTVEVPPRRVRAVFMDPIAPSNRHYGVTFTSDQPVAAQWLRAVNWYNSKELMAFWSVPCVPQVTPANNTGPPSAP
jgi:hypothetical protein